MDPQELERAILEASEDVDALVVSGLFSVCNGWQNPGGGGDEAPPPGCP